MKANVKELAVRIARLSKADLDELSTQLMRNGISATLYRFSPIDTLWDNDRTEGYLISNSTITMPNAFNVEFSLKLITVPRDRRLRAVKIIKEHLGLGLREAKDLLDSIPITLTNSTSLEKLDALKDALEDIDATVEMETRKNS